METKVFGFDFCQLLVVSRMFTVSSTAGDLTRSLANLRNFEKLNGPTLDIFDSRKKMMVKDLARI